MEKRPRETPIPSEVFFHGGGKPLLLLQNIEVSVVVRTQVRATASLSLAQVAGCAVSALRLELSRTPAVRDPATFETARALCVGCLSTARAALDCETAPDARASHAQAIADVLEHLAQSAAGGLEHALLLRQDGAGEDPDSHAPLAVCLTQEATAELCAQLLAHSAASTARRREILAQLAQDENYDECGEDADASTPGARDSYDLDFLHAYFSRIPSLEVGFFSSTRVFFGDGLAF